MTADVFPHITQVFEPFLSDDAVTEVVVNRPDEIGVERAGEWEWHDADLPFDTLEAIGIQAAFHSGQDISASNPICTANLPGGERIHICLPPVTDNGMISLTIRRPPGFKPTVALLEERGMFDAPDASDAPGHAAKAALGAFAIEATLAEKLVSAVLARKNILICGATGSGKTTMARALLDCIPLYERLVTVEDTREWLDIGHRNWVPLKYSKDGQRKQTAMSKDLVECGLRMRPDRVLLGELRDEAAFHWMRNAIAGHPGGVTTLHASSARGAFDALRLMCRESSAGQTMPDADIREMLESQIDIVIHCKHEPKLRRYWIDDVYEKERAQ